MSKQDQLEEGFQLASERINVLIEMALYARDISDKGPWSQADYEEIQDLARILRDRLPKKFHDIVSEGYTYESFKQLNCAQRLNRALLVDTEYGFLRTAQKDLETSDELEPKFELAESEKAEVLKLSDQMRKIVFSSAVFDEPHKKRLLDRIAAIEKEVHQPKGRLDVILAGVSDVGDTLKKFGGDLKPLSDRMREIKSIAQSNSKEYVQIPAPEDVKKLPAPEDGEED